MLVQVGTTQDGRRVVCGVFRFVETHGVPLDALLDILDQRRTVPCWMSYYREARAAGMKHDRILSKLDAAVSDVYGSAFRDRVIHALETLKETGHLV